MTALPRLLLLLAVSTVLANVSALAPPPTQATRLLAHRGVHQTFTTEGLTGSSCTARMIFEPTHGYLENTLPSIGAAFDAGAAVVELDLHRTADGHLVVLHDATLDCRTEATGTPEEHTLAELRGLDLGYGYTADDGITHPLRGTGVGLMVTLPEVLANFPEGSFLLDLKGNNVQLGEAVADVLQDLPDVDRARHSVTGAPRAVDVVTARLPDHRVIDRRKLKSCLYGYLALGWSGYVPAACANTWVIVPINYAPYLWGFPRRFEERMGRVGSDVVLMGPPVGPHSTGIDGVEQARRIPTDFGGYVWTNRVEVLAEGW